MKLNKWHWTALALAVVSVAVVLLLSSLPRLIESKLKTELAKHGISEFELGDPYWGLTGAGTTGLRFSGASGGWQYQVSLVEVQAHYLLSALLDGSVDALQVGSADIDVVGEASSSAAEPVDLGSILADLSALNMPVSRVIINNLSLRLHAADQTIRVTSERLQANSAQKQLSGSVQVELDNEQGEAYPQLVVDVIPGHFAWIPDISLRLDKGSAAPITGTVALREVATGWSESSSYTVNFSLDVPGPWPAVAAHYIHQPSLKAAAQQTSLSTTITGSLGFPALVNPQAEEWYLKLPFELAGSFDVVSSLPDQGLPVLQAGGIFSGEGSAESFQVTLPEPLAFDVEIDGTFFELPEELLSDRGALSLAGSLAAQHSITVANFRAISGLLLANVSLTSASSSFTEAHLVASAELVRNDKRITLALRDKLAVDVVIAKSVRSEIADIVGGDSTAFSSLGIEIDPGTELIWNADIQSLVMGGVTAVSLLHGPSGVAREELAQLTLRDFEYAEGQATGKFDGVLNFSFRGNELPKILLSGGGGLVDGHWKVQSVIEIPAWSMTVDGRADVTTHGQGKVVEVKGSARVPQLRTLIPPLRELGYLPIDLSLVSGGGTVDFSARLGSGEPRYRAAVELDTLTGIAGGVAFSKARVGGVVAIDKHWSTPSPITIEVPRASSGVEVSNIHAVISLVPSKNLEHSRWLVESFSAGLFAGDLALKAPAEIVLPDLGNRLTFQLSNMQLGNILDLYKEQGVSGNGTLNGEIPLMIEKEGVRVEQGRLSAEHPGGKIAFLYEDTASLAKTSEQLAMAVKMLENFNYEVLDVSTDFLPSGDLTLAVGLVGSNPNEFDGRTVNFNINFQENIFQLFKVLQLTDDLNRKIEKRLEKRALR